MIRFALRCPRDHRFEGWFASGAAYERQAAAGEVACPCCGSTDIVKALMAPAVGASGGEVDAPGPASAQTGSDAALTTAADPRVARLVEAVRTLRRRVEETADYVGDRFADEARLIHREEAEQRDIYGEASLDEARALADEGIAVHPLLRLPEDGH